jgi:diguanylate cyclase (GGDEF)-like protein/PAS domain S-box-containing protein
MPMLVEHTQTRKLRLGPVLFVLAGSTTCCLFFLGNWAVGSPGYRQPSALRYDTPAELFLWLGYTAFAAVLFAILYNLRKILPVKPIALAFLLFCGGHAARHYLEEHVSAYPDSWLDTAMSIFEGALAVVTACCLPLYYRRISSILERASISVRDEARLSAAMESTLVSIFMCDTVRDRSGAIVDFVFVFANPTAEKMIGLSREHLVGKRLSEINPHVYRDGRLELYRKVVETGEPWVFDTETRILNAGTGRESSFVRIHISKLGDGALVTCLDVTAERLSTQSLKRSLAYNKAIVASSSFTIIITEPDGTISSVNPAGQIMLGYSEEELVGRNIIVLHDQNELTEIAQRYTEEFGETVPPDSSVLRVRLAHGLEEEREWTYLCRNNLRIPVQVNVNTIEDERGSVIAYMASSYDLTDRKQTDQYIYHIAHHDPLTGLPGRSLLRDSIETAIEVNARTRSQFAVLIFDLDQFKRINDSLGHDTGDLVLREVALRLRSTSRNSDTVARFGDQFVVILNGLADRSEAEITARKLRDSFAPPISADGHQIVISASVGISIYPETSSADELLKHADIALDHGKMQGRNGLAVFTPDLGKKLLEKLHLETALRKAIANNELFLVYQPQISLTDHTLVGVEALMRWRRPGIGLVLPSVFIPIAEESGLITDIGAWCLETACRDIAQLQREVGYELSVAVNLSPNQVHGVHFQQTIERALSVSGLSPSSLEVEITEGLLMRDSEETLQILEGIQALGVTTAIDDFGTGFSNMSYITRFKVDRLKIDRSFVSKCLTDANSLAVTTAIIALAHSLNMEVIAEGVETVDQATMLRDLECDSAQGYLYSKPLTLADVSAFTRTLHEFGANGADRSKWMYQPRNQPHVS